MADLNELQSAGTTKIVGADATGLETNPLAVDVSGNAQALVNNPAGAGAVNIQDGGNSITVDGTVTVSAGRTVSAANSTATPLGISGVFTGAWTDALGFSGVSVIAKASQASAALGLVIQWSSDGTNIDDTDSYTLAANTGKQYSFGLMARYFRVIYTNGVVAQATFRLQTILHTGYFKPSSHRLGDNITDEDDSEIVKAVITGKRPDGSYGPINIDVDGNFIITALSGFGADFTFGDITTAALTQVVVRRTAYTEQSANAQRSIASASANDTAAGTGARTVRIKYYDVTGIGPLWETVTLNGTTYVNTVATNICYIEQMEVLTVGSGLVNAGILTLKAATAGGGATIGTINAGDNQTFWAHHYVALGKTCNITGISCGHNGTTVGSGALFVMRARNLNLATAAENQVSDFVRLYGQSSTFSRVYQSPIKVVGPARLLMYCTPETASSTIYRSSIDFFEP